ncbi:MAG: EAL domain-containing protein [Velocimicrobium sp.]
MAFLVSGLFYIASLSCMLMGIYLLYSNKNMLLNKLAFLLFTSLSCWSFGMVHSFLSSDYGDALVFRRFAAIGAGTFFSFFLHYLIILTKNERIVKRKIITSIIYIPSIFIVYFFAISGNVSKQVYQLEKTPIGWISTTLFSGWSAFFNIYSNGFMLIGLYMVYHWKQTESENQKKKQASLIFVSCLIAVVVGIVSEILDNLFLNSFFHEFSLLSLLLPVGVVYYALANYNFMRDGLVNEDMIFMERFRKKIIKYLTVAFCIGGVFYFLMQYLKHENVVLGKFFSFSCLLILFGICMYAIRQYVNNQEIKTMLYSILISASIPIITLQFIQYASITVWAYPFIILIAVLLFNNYALLIMVSTSMIVTQLYLWIKVPYCQTFVDTPDYMGRIIIMGLGIYLVCFINQIYMDRLKQLSDKIREQDLLFLISSASINCNYENLNEKMTEILRLLCEYIQADRAHIYYINIQDDMEHLDYYSYSKENGKIEDNGNDYHAVTECIWWKNQVNHDGVVQISDVANLPREALEEKKILLRENVKALVAVPLISQEKEIGYLRIDFIKEQEKWLEQGIKVLTIIGNIIGELNIRASSELKMKQMAYYDQLTNIPNRQLFGQHINQEIIAAKKNGELFGVLFLDLDSFKMVNDISGHHFGDKLLVMIAKNLEKLLRRTDMVCRFGGDEFLIMIRDIKSQKEIKAVVKKIIKKFKEPLVIEGQEVNITASIGIAVFPMDGKDKNTLIRNADIAMYKAKSNGKNQYVFCSKEMKEEMEETMILTKQLYRAKERGELYVVFQPQVSIESGKVIAMEALIRWKHPELGTISPAMFIPIAEHTGLINSIGKWVLKEACKQNKIWQDMGLPCVRIAVNVSVNQLLTSNFTSKVIEILQETGLKACYLELEITENIAMQESDMMIGVLSKLKEIGVSLAIDDFGIEYSSLSRIKMLPVDRLKIDIQFIRGILHNQKDRVIIDVIIKLAKDMNLKVIAEGVEQEEQLAYLKEKRCDEVQGFYFYKPLARDEMQQVLKTI